MGRFYFSVLLVLILGALETGNSLCNLGRHHRNYTTLSTVYDNTANADKVLDGDFLNFNQGHCAATREGSTEPVWWSISLSSVSRIYKINLIFRENYIRHSGFYLYINNDEKSENDLVSIKAVYHERDPNPSFQNVIIFPDGYPGKQVYLYLNETNKENKIQLDLCEIEIIGCTENSENSSTDNCRCPAEAVDGLPVVPDVSETKVAFSGMNEITLQCHPYYIVMQNSSGSLEKCNFKRKCKGKTKVSNVSYKCLEVCRDAVYNESTTVLVNPKNSKPYYIKGENIILECKHHHKLIMGQLKRTCHGNLTWTGDEPVCRKVCRDAVYNESTTVLVNPKNSKPYYIKGENITLECKHHHKLIMGQLKRTCHGNLTWTGYEPVCRKCRCPCKRLKSQNFITDHQVLKKRIEQTKKDLKVNKTELSSIIRKKTSATDERKSAQGIGMALGVGVITTLVSLIICSDLPLIYRQIVQGTYGH